MSYLEEFKQQLTNQDIPRVLQLWEEYCATDEVNGLELKDILQTIKESGASASLGPYIELGLPLWGEIEEAELSFEVLKLLVDIQTTQSQQLADTAYDALKRRFSDQQYFNEKIRLVGLRTRENFTGAISNYLLLSHMNKGKFVFHTGGWGTGEIMDYSLVREELILEFEYVVGRREFSFENAFKTLVPLSSEHILSRRFGNPDALEEFARKDPVAVIQMLLSDLGPKTAAEIKEELCELVIPEEDWAKWWQAARAKIKKDTQIESPASVKLPFRLRDSELSHEKRFLNHIEKAKTTSQTILTIYNFSRDFPEILKSDEIKQNIRERLEAILEESELTRAQEMQVLLFQDQLFPSSPFKNTVESFIQQTDEPIQLVNEVDIVAFKKRSLIAIRKYREDWLEVFLSMLIEVSQTPLRDYVLKQLNTEDHRGMLTQKLRTLLNEPTKHPDAFVWYFQKIIADHSLPFGDQDGICDFFESLLILLHVIEKGNDQRELVKKIVNLLSAKRYELVRNILENTTLEYTKEFLLLVTKCQSLSERDIKILHSLAEVVHPSLGDNKTETEEEEDPTIWTTREGYEKLQQKIHHIGTVETVENAKEIEAARALGDLRENSEYKFALEKRSRLQAQLKLYSDQINYARILTEDDIHIDSVGVGSRIILKGDNGDELTYTLLGPWDADPDQHILSFQSKLAKEMIGLQVGDSIQFQNKDYKIEKIESYLS